MFKGVSTSYRKKVFRKYNASSVLLRVDDGFCFDGFIPDRMFKHMVIGYGNKWQHVAKTNFSLKIKKFKKNKERNND